MLAENPNVFLSLGNKIQTRSWNCQYRWFLCIVNFYIKKTISPFGNLLLLLNLNLLFTTDRQEEGDICIRMYKIGTSLIENVLSSSYENISSEMLCPKYIKKI